MGVGSALISKWTCLPVLAEHLDPQHKIAKHESTLEHLFVGPSSTPQSPSSVMSSLKNLLNPDHNYAHPSNPSAPLREKLSNGDNTSSTSNTRPQPSAEANSSALEEPPFRQHEPHPDCPDALTCLPDTDGRPQHTLPVILRCAILGSPRKRLTIREIYAAMEEKYPYYKTAGPTWKQSVRHHLSLNRLFERQPRPVTDPGFGSYWTVNLAAPPGTKRPRKRGRPNKGADGPGPVVAKKRGRPRKFIDEMDPPSITTLDLDPETSQYCHLSNMRTGGDQSDAEDDDMLTHEEKDEIVLSDEDYESEEDMLTPPSLHPSYGNLRAFGIKPVVTPLASSTRKERVYRDKHAIEFGNGHKVYVEDSRSEEAFKEISAQLAMTQAETSRAIAALRSTEAILGEEVRKRRDAETTAKQENELRRKAEESLEKLQAQLAKAEGSK